MEDLEDLEEEGELPWEWLIRMSGTNPREVIMTEE
jgi:hypothetical protein